HRCRLAVPAGRLRSGGCLTGPSGGGFSARTSSSTTAQSARSWTAPGRETGTWSSTSARGTARSAPPLPAGAPWAQRSGGTRRRPGGGQGGGAGSGGGGGAAGQVQHLAVGHRGGG